MSGTSAKRVVLYRFDRQPTEGFVGATKFNLSDELELMSPDGNLLVLRYTEIKAVCFVSEGGVNSLFSQNTTFERRPKISGLWVRFVLRDGDRLEGVLPHDLTEWPEAGFLAVPPKSGAQRQRVFLPRAALAGTELLGVIGKPVSPQQEFRRDIKPRDNKQDQLSMFD